MTDIQRDELLDTAVAIEAGFDEYMHSLLPKEVQPLYTDLNYALREVHNAQDYDNFGEAAIERVRLTLYKLAQMDMAALPEDLLQISGVGDLRPADYIVT